MRAQAADPEERSITARAKAGEEEAFRELVERYSRDLFRLAYRMTGSKETAEDVVQETFLKAYRALHRFDEKSRFSTWIYRIASNCALDDLRRRERQGGALRPEPLTDERGGDPFDRYASIEPGPVRLALSSEVERRLQQSLSQLTPIERTAFVLRHFEERSIAEIGQVLGSRTNATKQAVFRAVRKLRRDLLPWLEESHARSA